MVWLWPDLYRMAVLKEKKKVFSIDELYELIKTVSLEEKIWHIFTLDLEFSDINPKTPLFNEIYLPIFEKIRKFHRMKDQPHK